MEIQSENLEFGEQLQAPKKPQFLTILCILSFICCGFLFIATVYGIIMNTPENQMENIERMREFSPAGADKMEQALLEQQNSVMGQIQPYLNLLFILLSFLGVLQMFNLKKMGFYIYTFAELFPMVLMFFSSKEMVGMLKLSMGEESGETAAYLGIAIVLFFDLAFVVMYGLNLKHMKN